MVHVIIRGEREGKPRYGVYSTIVDNFIWVNGTRKETLEYLVEDYRPGTDRYEREKADAINRLDKADEYGSDSMMGRARWDDSGLTIMNNKPCGRDGWLPRQHIAEFMRRLEHEKNTDDLVESLKDD